MLYGDYIRDAIPVFSTKNQQVLWADGKKGLPHQVQNLRIWGFRGFSHPQTNGLDNNSSMQCLDPINPKPYKPSTLYTYRTTFKMSHCPNS